MLSGGFRFSIIQSTYWSFVNVYWAAHFPPLLQLHLYFLLFPSSVVWWWLGRQMVLSATVALTLVSIQSVHILLLFTWFIAWTTWCFWTRREACRSVFVAVKDLWCQLSSFIGFFAETARTGTVVSRANSIGSTSASSVPNTGIVSETEGF